ncbi:MAG TPA: carboxypeptidase regulatory-like domain-containing protein [Blastocatellia bacterium]|nr:carboxypeptidase regulatory-like domain-containing protein [Blastocatellia bacterium]
MNDHTSSITGRITIQGKPAPDIEISLLPQPYRSGWKTIATTRTDDDGRYRFAELPSNHYWLKVHAPRCVNSVEWDDEGPGRAVSVAYGQSVQNADLDLLPGGTITGRITDEDGRPIAGEYVELTLVDKLGPPDDPLDLIGEESDFTTDSTGTFRIHGIPQGRYRVSIGVEIAKVTGSRREWRGSSEPTGRVEDDHYYHQVFYPGVSDRAQARVIDISPGAEVNDINIKLGKAFRAFKASGQVIEAGNRKPVSNCRIRLSHWVRGRFNPCRMLDDPCSTDEAGAFTVQGLVPGRFSVSGYVEGESEFFCNPVTFEILDDDITELEIRAVRGVTLAGSVIVKETHTESIAPMLAQLRLQAVSPRRDGGGDFREGVVNPDGSFTIHGLPPGEVQVSLGYGDASNYFSIVRIEYPDKAGETSAIPIFPPSHPWNRFRLALPERGLIGVRIVLSYNNGSIRGNINVGPRELDPGHTPES